MEVIAGVHRIESELGDRMMCQYLLVGEERLVLIDSGIAETPSHILAGYMASIGLSCTQIDMVIISHADVDHCGGNRSLRGLANQPVFFCHELDRRWIEDNDVMLSENYSWYEAHGFVVPLSQREWIRCELGGDSPIDVGLRGGETLRVGQGQCFQILHLPGHTAGHLGLWNPTTRVAIIMDAVLERGVRDREGMLVIPPRYYDLEAYSHTIALTRSLDPELLLTAHYPVMAHADAREFLERSRMFVAEVETAVAAAVADGMAGLADLTQRVSERIGEYPDPTELAASIRAHLVSGKSGGAVL